MWNSSCRLRAKLFLLTLLSIAFSVSVATAEEVNGPYRWADAMAAFEAADLEAPPTPGGIVFVGSSSIRMWDLSRWFGELDGPVLNRGFGGSEIEDSVQNLELLVLRHQPRAIVLYAGDNDVANGKLAERVEQDFEKFVARVRSVLHNTPIYFISIKPSTARWELADTMRDANARISAHCNTDPLLNYIDIWTPMLGEDGKPREELLIEDGLHLTDAGYELWSGLVREALGTE